MLKFAGYFLIILLNMPVVQLLTISKIGMMMIKSGTGAQELFPEVLYLKIGDHVIKDDISECNKEFLTGISKITCE